MRSQISSIIVVFWNGENCVERNASMGRPAVMWEFNGSGVSNVIERAR